ncbi:16S rRNA (cytidine(1402)-2'-O)-methyltransferase [soil metagenome]
MESYDPDFKKTIPENCITEFPEIIKGALYIVATPIGNLKDISFRALDILKNVDLIAAEDTRTTGILLSHYGIKNKQTSYYSFNESERSKQIIESLKNGQTVALVSDSGTPGISDPGGILISECIENDIPVIPVPGANAFIHALVLSGFSTKRFFFQGFLPLKKGRQTLFKELKEMKMPVIIYESPHRIEKTLKEIIEHIGNREIALCRELTKKFEEIIRDKAKNILANKNKLKLKGEFVLIIDNK